MKKIKEIYLKYRELIAYVIVGALTTIVSLGSYYLCVVTFLNPKIPMQLQLANIISWICAVLFAFVTNRKYVFNSNNKKMIELIKFVGARLTTLIIDMGCMALLVTLAHINDKIAKLLVQIIVFVLNYVFSKFFVFKKRTQKN